MTSWGLLLQALVPGWVQQVSAHGAPHMWYALRLL